MTTKALKGGEYIIRDSSPSEIFIPEDFNEDQRMVRQMCKDFVAEMGEKANVLSEQVGLMEKAGELGLLGAHIPEVYGGNPLDTNSNTLIGEELGRAGGSFDTTFAAHIGIGMLPILYFGTDEQKKKYLPGLSSGSHKASYCLTEPWSGSDALGARTRADLSADQKHYTINGQKMWISNAGFADVFIVFAKIGGEQFTGFIVDAHSPGITLGEEEKKLGIKGSSTRQVFFENVDVPAENVLGKIGQGHLIAFNALNIGRFKLGTMAMGGSKKCIDIAVKYANERQQFGVSISSFGAIKHKLGEMASLIFALESASYRLSDMMGQHKDESIASGSIFEMAMLDSAKEYASECAVIKIAGSEYLDFVVDEMLQIHGGNGYSEEYPAARAYRDQRINRIYEGTNEINRLLLVDRIIKKALKGELDLVGPAWAVQKELMSMPAKSTDDGPWAAEIQAIHNFKKSMLLVAGAAVKYQMDGKHDLNHEQEVVMHIADISIDCFIAESVLLRARKLADGQYNYPADVVKSLTQLFIGEAQARIQKHANDALTAFATGDELIIMLKGVKRFNSYPTVNTVQARRVIADDLIKANGYSLEF
ncbi:MAG: acyl-CoA dehydrogenase family protein [Saprospiraceae bacterium]|uniref:Acyl-CoA dehydrogenase family protein n=1 Tax=Candidatus Opimibacter skivensis TaxID=2982028 RepID=A0A9D7XUG5_9BACT|nr:acyl-CoA dehydrogenase family protein [Candidatus Opimibacter skivensis]